MAGDRLKTAPIQCEMQAIKFKFVTGGNRGNRVFRIVFSVISFSSCSSGSSSLAEQCPARLRLRPVNARARRGEEHAAVLAPRQVRRQLRENNAPQERAVRAAYPYPARSGAEHVPLEIDLEAVGYPRVIRSHVQQDAAVRQGSIRAHIESPDVLALRVVDVQLGFIRREREAVRQHEVIRDELHSAVGSQAVYPLQWLIL